MSQEKRLPDQQAIENFGDDEDAVFPLPETRTLGNGCGSRGGLQLASSVAE